MSLFEDLVVFGEPDPAFGHCEPFPEPDVVVQLPEVVVLPRTQVYGSFDQANVDVVKSMVERLHPDLLSAARKLFLGGKDVEEYTERFKNLKEFLKGGVVTHQVRTPRKDDLIRYDPRVGELQIKTGEKWEGVCAGTRGEILDYVVNHCPNHYPNVLHALREQDVFDLEYDEKDDWDEKLCAYRKFRLTSKSLDKITKLSQQYFLDESHQVARFARNPTDPPIDLFRDTLSAKRGVPFPIQLRGAELWNYEEVFDKVIAGSVVEGDGDSIRNNLVMLEKFYRAAKENVVHVELKIDKNFPKNIKGYLYNKFRPHNLVAVFELDPDGSSIRELMAGMVEGIWKANEERNKRFFELPFEVKERLLSPNDMLYMTNVKMKSVPEIKCRPEKFKDRPDNKRLRKRREEFHALCMDPTALNKLNDFGYLKLHNCIFYGPLKYNDINIGTPEVTFRSLVEYGKGQVRYDRTHGWEFATE